MRELLRHLEEHGLSGAELLRARTCCSPPGDQPFLEVSGLGDLTGDGVEDVLLGGRLDGKVVVLPGVP